VIETKFDEAISKEKTQIDVFNHFRGYLPKIPEGYNLTVFAYGQTGSGKTYTMFGSDWENAISKHSKQQHQNTFFEDLLSDENYAGLIPRTIFGLFEEIKAYTSEKGHNFNIYCSFLQIYNEKIYDLLQVRRSSHRISQNRRRSTCTSPSSMASSWRGWRSTPSRIIWIAWS
jgi:hypothetical protein